jgi:hypothetical protein
MCKHIDVNKPYNNTTTHSFTDAHMSLTTTDASKIVSIVSSCAAGSAVSNNQTIAVPHGNGAYSLIEYATPQFSTEPCVVSMEMMDGAPNCTMGESYNGDVLYTNVLSDGGTVAVLLPHHGPMCIMPTTAVTSPHAAMGDELGAPRSLQPASDPLNADTCATALNPPPSCLGL